VLLLSVCLQLLALMDTSPQVSYMSTTLVLTKMIYVLIIILFLVCIEYAYTLKVDEKSDVYSFGVVLLELIAGKKPVGEFGEGVDIVRWVRNTEEEITQPSDAAIVVAIVDPRLTGYPLTSVIHVFKIAMMCVEEEAAARPTMREVVHMLTNPPKSVANLIAF